jgi:hypothetical protein
VAVLTTGPFAGGVSRHQPAFPAHGPAEFLYLDGTRVLAYLAQFDGGTFTSKQLTSKSSDTVNSKVSVESALELGETSQQEESISKQITPTAAGNFIELLSKLEKLHDGLETIGLGRFRHEVQHLTEGQFVRFQTHGLTPPVYLNPYLAVRQRETLSTLYPMPPKGDGGRALVSSQRARARGFRRQVGGNPRVVFALRPLNAKELEEMRTKAGKGKRESKEQVHRVEEDHVQYLMPMDAQLLTRERSLIKFGGGEFTVVGKVVRIFPENGNDHTPAYVDSPTRETWQQPLTDAPLNLLCRTDPECSAKVRQEGVKPGPREEAIEDSEARDIDALNEQTEIPRRGAVILPIAIYK